MRKVIQKYSWLSIVFLILICLSVSKGGTENKLELSYESINRNLPYYQMTVAVIDPHALSRMGTCIFDYAESSKQTLKYSHLTQRWVHPVEIQLTLAKEEGEGSWDTREPGGYWWGQQENLDSTTMRGTFIYFLPQDLGLKLGFARDNLNYEGLIEDNTPPLVRVDWARKDHKDSLALGIEKSLSKNFKLECDYAFIEENQTFSSYGEATTGRWTEDIGDGESQGGSWFFEATYSPEDSLCLKLSSSFENTEGEFQVIRLTSEGEEYRELDHSYTRSLKESQHHLTLGFPLSKRLSVDLGYFIDKRNRIYNYLDNSTLDFDFYKSGLHCGFQVLISSSSKLRIDYSHAHFERKDNWYYFSEEAPSWEGKGEENKLSLDCIFGV